MTHNPSNPSWFNRDRFVLSNGHGSMLLYALLHLTGYDPSMNEIRNFRQLGSKLLPSELVKLPASKRQLVRLAGFR